MRRAALPPELRKAFERVKKSLDVSSLAERRITAVALAPATNEQLQIPRFARNDAEA